MRAAAQLARVVRQHARLPQAPPALVALERPKRHRGVRLGARDLPARVLQRPPVQVAPLDVVARRAVARAADEDVGRAVADVGAAAALRALVLAGGAALSVAYRGGALPRD